MEGGKAIVTTDTDEHPYDLCLLTAGSNGTVAGAHFGNKIKRSYQWGCRWSTISLPEALSANTLHQRCQSSRKMMGILPVGNAGQGQMAALYWSVMVSQYQQAGAEQLLEAKKEICEFWPQAGSSIQSLAPSDFSVATYNDVWTPQPHHQRIVVLGDASHATSPQLGQGCTMELLDAWLLAHCMTSEHAIEKALATWWALRKHQLMYVRHLSRFLTPLYQSDRRRYAWFRDNVVAPMGRLPGLYRLQLKTLASEVLLKNK